MDYFKTGRIYSKSYVYGPIYLYMLFKLATLMEYDSDQRI